MLKPLKSVFGLQLSLAFNSLSSLHWISNGFGLDVSTDPKLKTLSPAWCSWVVVET